MSDHDANRDPIDKAYAEAEAMLDDEAARAARRARLLAAVAAEPVPAPAVAAPPVRRSAWGRGGWLVAAGVAGLSVVLATQVYPPAPTVLPPSATPAPAAPAVRSSQASVPKSPPPSEPAPPPRPAPPPPAVAARAEPPAAADLAPPPPPAAPAPSQDVQELVVTGQRREASPAASVAARSSPGAAAGPAARLREAAAGGEVDAIEALLAKGVRVDAPDDEGETALMKAIRAERPAAAALLRRHGASLDRRNRAGVSARELAAAIGDAELNRALGLDP